jgi:cobalt-zinc-cadmium resistance protein CzcA
VVSSLTWVNTKKSAVWRFGFVILGGGFTTMGGEFIPTLDEGDFVIQPFQERP